MTYPIKEGKIPYDAKGAGKPCETYYKIVGDLKPGVTPVIALHGGPGGGHEYLHPLTDLYTNFGLPVIFYDQIGCGASTHLREKMGDDSFWTIELFVAELENLITYFKLHDTGFHLFGLSWGGMFCSLYASRKPKGLGRLIMLSSPASIPLYHEGLQDILQEMGPEAQEIVRRCDEQGTQDSEEYQGVCAKFGRMHTCRLDPPPEELKKAFANLKDDGTSILTMQGHSRFVFTGAAFKDYEGAKEWGHLIEVPTLVANGEYDHVKDKCFAPWFWHIPKVRWVSLKGASHVGQWEARERIMGLAGEFLTS